MCAGLYLWQFLWARRRYFYIKFEILIHVLSFDLLCALFIKFIAGVVKFLNSFSYGLVHNKKLGIRNRKLRSLINQARGLPRGVRKAGAVFGHKKGILLSERIKPLFTGLHE